MVNISKIARLGLCLAIFLLLLSCSNTRHLPAGDSLFVGSSLKIKDNEAARKEKRLLRADLVSCVKPKANTKFLGLRLKLSMFDAGGGDSGKHKAISGLLYKMGEPPVLFSTVNKGDNENAMTGLLQNRGFFFPSVKANIITKKKKTHLEFDIVTGPQYKINNVFYETDSSRIAKTIYAARSKTLLKKGLAYNLELLKGERERIERVLKRQGFYFFKADDILLQIDSSIGSHKIDIKVTLKGEQMKQEDYTAYTIHDVYIFSNYRINGNSNDTAHYNASEYRGYKIVDPMKRFKPIMFSRNLMFEPGQLYNLRYQNNSLSRLVNLGAFKFVKNRLEVSLLSDTMLDVYYYLTPAPKYTLRFQAGVLSQYDSRTGSQFSVSWLNRNTFKGAELLQIKLNAGFEGQYSSVVSRPGIFTIGSEINLSFPQFVIPFTSIKSNSAFTPKTFIKTSYNYETETQLLTINSYKASYGYDWKEDAHKEHQLYPINFTYVKTDTLRKSEALKVVYGNLVFNGIIFGPTYEFTYNSQLSYNKKSDDYFFDGVIDFSVDPFGASKGTSNSGLLSGMTVAQYIKLQPDFRHYHHFTQSTTLASRMLIGIGVPYGNSNELPNIKQFYSGGNSSLRGFRSRLVGPGTFNEQYIFGTNNYLQTLGDIKLEINSELRTHVYKSVNTALFVDAGNVWLYNNNPLFPGGQFTSSFINQLAIDVGIGLRFDFKIFLLRLDMGVPIRQPWLNQQSSVPIVGNAGNSSGGINGVIFNLAIGYPY